MKSKWSGTTKSQSNLRVEDIKWSFIIAFMASYNIYCHKNSKKGDTFSEFIRRVFKPETLAGKITLCAAYTTFSAWVLPHWIKTIEDVVEEMGD